MSFIYFHSEKEVVTQFNYAGGVHLLPKDPKPYVQLISGNVGESYEVYIVDPYGCQLDVTDHIEIRNYGDSMVFKIIYLPFDFSSLPVRFRIISSGNVESEMFSNSFLLTNENKKYTSRIDYKIKGVDFPSIGIMQTESSYQSIRVQFYLNNIVDATEVETYYQITRSQNINQNISIEEYNQYATLPISEVMLSKIATAFYNGVCYVDFVRNYIVEGFDRAEREGASNISENIFLTDPDEKDTINIINEIIDPSLTTVPFLASSDQLASSEYLVSQEFIQI